jgi:hypothetical protein
MGLAVDTFDGICQLLSWVHSNQAADKLSSRHRPQSSLYHCPESSILLSVLQVMTICKILEGLLPKETVRGAPPPDKKLLEYHFVFACVWAFGSCMLVDKVRQRAFLGCFVNPKAAHAVGCC